MTDYTKFYGFSENPFDISPNPKFFFPSESHREALASLQYGITYRKGFILVLGEAGIGKTMLIQHLISTLDQQVKIIYFPQSQIPIQQMLKEMLNQLKLPSGLETKGSMIHSLYDHLLQCVGHNENVVVILDEAENIKLNLIEEVRLLANLETGTSKLLQIVLVGKPELRKKLGSDIVRQIKQRIVINSRITSLTEEESRQYIDHRLKVADSESSRVFTDEALSLICSSARGIPLALNTLCSNALSLGCHLSEKRISASTVRRIRHKKDILTADEARILAVGIGGRIPRKIVLILPAIVILAAAVFFGRTCLQPIFTSMETKDAVTPPALKEATIIPEVKHPVKTDPIQSNLSPKITDSVPTSPHITADQPSSMGAARPEIRVIKTIEAKEGINLSSLAYRYYDSANETLIDHILKINPEIKNPDLILINQKIRIPEITESLLIVQYPEGLYKIHLRTFADMKSADEYRRVASSWAQKIEIVPWKISAGKAWHRVMTGPFISRDEALRTLDEMKRKGFSIIPSKTEKQWTKR